MDSVDIVLQSIQNNVRQVDVLSHNIANANTPGYQAQQVFSEYMGENKTVLVESSASNGASGVMSTGRDLDVAMLNDAFMLVELNGQPGITRNGRMYTDENGQLKHASGAYVMGENGFINLPVGSVQINQQGQILVNGEVVDKLVSMKVGKQVQLNTVGSGVYTSDTPMELTDNAFKQYSVNGSTVSTSHDMVRLIELSRHTQSLQKAVHAIDQIADAGINELGKR